MIWVAAAFGWVFIGWLTMVIVSRVANDTPPVDTVVIGLMFGPVTTLALLFLVAFFAVNEFLENKFSVRKFLLMKEKK